MEHDASEDLLQRWHAGDPKALAALLQRDLDFVAAQVRRRLGDQLRQLGETQDFVQDVVVDFLRNGPRVLIRDPRQFRAFLVRVIENVLIDRHRWQQAARRDARRLEALPTETVVDLDSGASAQQPSRVAARHEEQAWIRVALELLPAEDRQVILFRDWDELGFAEIGTRLGLTEDAARMRYVRALPRLAQTVKQLRERQLAQLLGPVEEA